MKYLVLLLIVVGCQHSQSRDSLKTVEPTLAPQFPQPETLGSISYKKVAEHHYSREDEYDTISHCFGGKQMRICCPENAILQFIHYNASTALRIEGSWYCIIMEKPAQETITDLSNNTTTISGNERWKYTKATVTYDKQTKSTNRSDKH